MKSIDVRAGERTRIIRRFSNSLNVTYRFRAEPLEEGDAVSGTVEVAGSNWIFPKAPTTLALKAENSVAKGMWDTFYSVYVTPDCDVRITFDKSSLGRSMLLLALVALVAFAAASIILLRQT